jgi:hypothetical protein
VTLSDLTSVTILLERWPWDGRSDRHGDEEVDGPVKDATLFGFRTLSKRRWDALQHAYLAHRQRLLSTPSAPLPTPRPPLPRPPQHDAPPLDPDYPPNRLVFVKNVHPETNKTTLRALFESESGGGVDYVDFSKGMDSVSPTLFLPSVYSADLFFSQCYVRLSSPTHASHLVSHFTSNPLVQSHALDDTGRPCPPSSTDKPITVELVLGKKEAVYWEKVPEKIRRQAATGAVSAVDGGDERKRKRRRKG